MKLLVIGGTGKISTAVVQEAVRRGMEVTVLNRGTHTDRLPEGTKLLKANYASDTDMVFALTGLSFDCVANFIAFTPEQVKRDIKMFSERCGQYMFISTAAAYVKHRANLFITEDTPLKNPHWQYARDKIACEETLMHAWRENDFPVTVVRPSHTYADYAAPVALHGANGSFSVVKRISEQRPVLIPGDGTSLWTLTHAEDFARGFAGLIGNPAAIGESVHITSDEYRTWNAIYGMIAAAIGVPLHAVHVSSENLIRLDPSLEGSLLGDKANCTVFDNSKLKRLVPGFRAQLSIPQGIERTLRYISAHPELQVEDPQFDFWCDRVINVFTGILPAGASATV